MESAQAQNAQSALRPRDIQARIRAGETPESVAEIAQVPVDKIMGYAVPVMAERQHMAERAQRSAVRRRQADGPATQLWDAVADQLRPQNVDPLSCQWDAWRREDGRWTVTVRYRGRKGERTGRFVYDALSRYAVADDDDARWLVGEQPEHQEPRRSGRQTSPHGTRSRGSGDKGGDKGNDKGKDTGRRLSAVASEYDAMLFDDEEPTTDLTAVADALGEESQAEPERDPAPEVEEPVARTSRDEPPARPTRTARTRTAQQRGQHPKPEKRGRRGRGRASVPSWDEIMFGQPKS